jgi:hypothetical protein
MGDEALLLSGGDLSLESGNAAKVLHFFGVPWRAATVTEFLGYTRLNHESSAKSRALCSSDTFCELVRELENHSDAIRPWRARVHSVFVYASDVPAVLEKLLQRLTGGDGLVLDQMNRFGGDFVVSDQSDGFCGVMSGVRASCSKTNGDAGLVLNTARGNAINIISLGHGAIFLKLEYNGVPVFLSTSRKIIDIDAELVSQNFDVREHFLSAVPLVLYIKWAFAETCWSAPEANACLVIDDPLLKPTHGFVNFQELLSLMKRHKFTTNIAFIPWNWRRSAPEVVQLFKENPESYSISVHGCDHTRAEFGSSNQQRLYWKFQEALERMNRHQSTTGIRYDPVMVFPQGIFSEAAMSALKHTDLIAAVNNDVVPTGPHRRALMISELWDIAVMGYRDFPIFTRRYPWEGIENFAFDALLGKPAIAVIHHDYCSDHCVRLVDFIERLNALKCPPTWRSLGEALRRSYRQRELSSQEVELEMYAAELRIENRFGQPKRFLIRRRECEPSAIQEISDGSGSVTWSSMNGYINFEIELKAGESRIVRIKFYRLPGNGYRGDNLPYRFKATLRRYLCEIRDNYVTTTKSRLADFVSR